MDSLVCDKFVCSRLAELWNLELTVVTRPRMSDLLTRRSFALGFGAICGVLAPQRKWALAAAEAKGASALSPPIAPIIPARFENFGATRIDHYDWLRDREDPRVIAYLDAENAYAKAQLQPIKPLLDEIAAELQARATPEDRSVPTAYNGYFYQRRFVRGSQYPLIVRWEDCVGTSQEEIVLDVTALAAGQPRQFELGSWAVSPNNEHVAFTVDFNGNREFHIFVRTLPAGQVVDESIEDAASNVVFGGDSETLFYVRNAQTVRSYQLWRHRVGNDPKSDVLIYEEKDPSFSISLDLSKSRKFMLLNIEGEISDLSPQIGPKRTLISSLCHHVRLGSYRPADVIGRRRAPHSAPTLLTGGRLVLGRNAFNSGRCAVVVRRTRQPSLSP